MKRFIIAFAIIVALCNAYEEIEENVLLDPGFLTSTSWAHQIAYHEMQDEIDESFVEINKIVATALAASSKSALEKHEQLSIDILAEYDPVFLRVEGLPFNDCRANVITLIQSSVVQAGFIGGNCFTQYSRTAKSAAATATDLLGDFTGDYGKVVLNVYRSYVGKNAMKDAELIESNINNTFSSISANWANSKPSIESLRTTLTNSLNSIAVQLDTCFGTSFNLASTLLTIINPQVEECELWNSNSRAGRMAGSRRFKDYTPEFNEFVANYPEYVWQ